MEEKTRRYFTIGVAKKGDGGRIVGVVDICTSGYRKPTKAIASHLIPADRLASGYTHILDVSEISKSEAVDLYGLTA